MTTSLSEGQRWVSAFNSSTTTTIPPYAVLYVIGAANARVYLGISDLEVANEVTLEVQAPGAYVETNDSSDVCQAYDRTPLHALSSFGDRTENLWFNGPIPIAPLRMGRVTQDLPTFTRVCGDSFTKGYLYPVIHKYHMVRTADYPDDSFARNQTLWLLGLKEMDGDKGICLVCRKDYTD